MCYLQCFCGEFFIELCVRAHVHVLMFKAKQPSLHREQDMGHIPIRYVQYKFRSWNVSDLISQDQLFVKEDGLCMLRALSKCVSYH